MKIYAYNGVANVIGRRVRIRRRKMRISQTDLAARLQLETVMLDQKAVSRIERQERVVADYELMTLAKVLGVSVMWLLTGEEEEK